MIKIAFVIYRIWAYKIYKKLKKKFKNKVKFEVITPNRVEFKDKNRLIVNPKNNKQIFSILKKKNVEIVFFYGWSWLIDKEIYQNFSSFCLHPSKLPKYKGGSPIQHQIINNEKNSAVTVFKISKEIDGGDIYKQNKISLRGSLKQIFSRIFISGSIITSSLIEDYLNFNLKLTKQKKNKLKVLKRRNIHQSEINLDLMKSKSFNYLYNHIRMLDDPYPNAFVIINKKKIFIKKIHKKIKKINQKYISKNTKFIKNLNGHFICLKDSDAKIIESFK